MSRTLTDHVVTGDENSAAIRIETLDAPGQGGANHVYLASRGEQVLLRVDFQKGPIAEHGINGVTNEVLLAIVADRLQSFQAGPFACKENAEALHYTHMALDWLKQRTRDRIARGVEGKSQT